MNTFEFRNNGPLPKGRWMPLVSAGIGSAAVIACMKCGENLIIKQGTGFADDGTLAIACPCGFKDSVQLVGHPSAVPRPKVEAKAVEAEAK